VRESENELLLTRQLRCNGDAAGFEMRIDVEGNVGFGSLPHWPSTRLRVKSAEKCIAYKAALWLKLRLRMRKEPEAEDSRRRCQGKQAAESSQWKAYKLRCLVCGWMMKKGFQKGEKGCGWL